MMTLELGLPQSMFLPFLHGFHLLGRTFPSSQDISGAPGFMSIRSAHPLGRKCLSQVYWQLPIANNVDRVYVTWCVSYDRP